MARSLPPAFPRGAFARDVADRLRFEGGALCLALSAGAFAVTPTEADYNSMNMSISANYNATYAVATEKCDEFSANSEALCDKEANSEVIAAKVDADVALKTTDANAKAQQKTTDARMDAAADKRDATYGVAKEKCDVLTQSRAA